MPKMVDCAGGCGNRITQGRTSRAAPTCHPCRRARKAAGLPPPDSLAARRMADPDCPRCQRDRQQHVECPCGAIFHPSPLAKSRRAGGQSRTCSRSCGQRFRVRDHTLAAELRRERDRRKNDRRRYGVRDRPADGVTRLQIFERDGYVCQLCGEPTRPDAHWRDGRAPTLDHVVPISLGGDNLAANKQCAHRSCNIRKGNRVS